MDSELEARWIERQRISSDAMRKWGQAEWASWWKDSLQIWFADPAEPHRSVAFAPFGFINEDRDMEPQDIIRQGLMFLPEHARNAMSDAALEVLQDQAHCTTASAELILDFYTECLKTPKTFNFIKAVLDARKAGWLTGDEGNLLSIIGYGLAEDATQDQTASLSADFEPILKQVDNFRTVLSYSIALHQDSREKCLEKFNELWTGESGEGVGSIWRSVNQRLDQYYGKSPPVSGARPAPV